MDDRDGKIWFNGELVEWRSATTHVLTHTLHYGMGVFEGVRAYETPDGPAIFRLQDHTKRLFNSAKIVGMQLPFTEEQINRAHIDVVKANNLASCYFRPMAYYGSGKLGRVSGRRGYAQRHPRARQLVYPPPPQRNHD